MRYKKLNKRLFGWIMFDWATQPYSTLLLTFIFAPYFSEIVIDKKISLGVTDYIAKAEAQSLWGLGLTISGIIVACLAPILGTMADSSGGHRRYISFFSVLYILGAGGLWLAIPETFNIVLVLSFFIIGLVGMELATIFTNSFLPTLGTPEEIGRISGNGWAMGYVGGLIALALALLFFAENKQGLTVLGKSPAFGLNAELREGTRAIGPLSALWFAFFMIPFFLFVRSNNIKKTAISIYEALKKIIDTFKKQKINRTLFTFLLSSMFYRDALNAIYSFGGLYAYGVLGWSVTDIGLFGILALVFGALFSWLGGIADSRFGPNAVIKVAIICLIIATLSIMMITPETIYGFNVSKTDLYGPFTLSDILFYFCGALIGGAGGVLQSASRTMVVIHSENSKVTEAFGFYAFCGKATAFLAPLMISIVTYISHSQRVGMLPIVFLFVVGFILLTFVKKDS